MEVINCPAPWGPDRPEGGLLKGGGVEVRGSDGLDEEE